MTKEEYLVSKGVLYEEKFKIAKKFKELKEKYINSNIGLPVGTKVALYGKDGHLIDKGVITAYGVGYTDNIEPIIYKLKKDGTPHKTTKLWVQPEMTIKPISE